jgi:hypothetical protein
MALPLVIVIASWILILSMVLGLCLSARQGDRQQLSVAPADLASDQIEPPMISTPITVEPARGEVLRFGGEPGMDSTSSGRRLYPCDPAYSSASATR